VKIIKCEQGDDQWLEMKFTHLGGSYAPILMGESIFSTPFQLWQKMLLKIKTPDNGAFARGRALEPIARELYQQDLAQYCGINEDLITPVVQSNEYPWMIASLDGCTPDLKRACEIKCVNREDHELSYKGQIPKHYFGQLQHIIHILDLKKIDYISYHPDAARAYVRLEIDRDNDYISRYLETAQKFYEDLCTFTEPKKTQKDYEDFTQNLDYRAAEAAYIDLCSKLDVIAWQKTVIKNKMIEMSGGKNINGAYTRMTNYFSKGHIEYNKIPVLQEIDLEVYRGKPIFGTRITKVVS